MRYENGEYMTLIFDGSPDAYYIMGHVAHKEGIDTLINEGVIDEESEVGFGVHKYGRWSIEPFEDGNRHVLREYQKPGRGRFKITVFGVGIYASKDGE